MATKLRTVNHVIERIKDLQATAGSIQYRINNPRRQDNRTTLLAELARVQKSIEDLSQLEVLNNE